MTTANGLPQKDVHIQVFRDSHGKWWMDENDVKRLAPNLKVDSQIVLVVRIVRKTEAF